MTPFVKKIYKSFCIMKDQNIKMRIFEIIDYASDQINTINLWALSDAELEEVAENVHDSIQNLESLLELYYCEFCPASDFTIDTHSKYYGPMHFIGLASKEDYYCEYHSKIKSHIGDMINTLSGVNINVLLCDSELKSLKEMIKING